MAEVKFTGPVTGLKGALSKSSGMYFRMVNGKTYLCRKGQCASKKAANSSAQKTADRQQINKERFRKANALCNEIMHTEQLKEWYSKKWRMQKKYPTLRGYVMAKMYQEIC